MLGGAFKRSSDYFWCHIICSNWIPEVYFRFPHGGEPIDLLMTPYKRHSARCFYCNSSYGICIECCEIGCQKWFHITCGKKNNIFLEYKKNYNKSSPDVVVSYCEEHGKRWTNKANKNKYSKAKGIVRANKT